MVMWCDHCGDYVRTDNASGTTWCSPCGRVLADGSFLEEESTFVKTSDRRRARMAGKIVKSTQAHTSESQKRALEGASAMRMWCSYCGENVRTDNGGGRKCCSLCGKFLAEDNFTTLRYSSKTGAPNPCMDPPLYAGVVKK